MRDLQTKRALRNFKAANHQPIWSGLSLGSKKNRIKICIKLPAPTWIGAHSWGDYHLAVCLRKQLIVLGYDVTIQPADEWYTADTKNYQVIFVLRGVNQYTPHDSKVLHILWNISHPHLLSVEEYTRYNHVYVASQKQTEKLIPLLGNKVSCLLQCTDPIRFKPTVFPVRSDILFVGNTRGTFRPVIKNVLPSLYNLSVYGKGWEKFIDHSYIKKTYLKNNVLYRHYSGAKIILNDHWKDMQTHGFISNRVFDVLACNGFIVSDNVLGLHDVFGDAVVTYSSPPDLNEKIAYFMKNDTARKKIAKKGRALILHTHTFANRAAEIDRVIKQHLGNQ